MMAVSRAPLQEQNLATKRLLPGQFDILTILVVTTAIAVVYALIRSPLRLDVKILAVSVALSVFLVWALWYHEGLRTHWLTIFAAVPWAMSLGLGVYLHSSITSGRGSLTISMLALLGIAFPAAMLLRQIYIIHQTISGRVHDTVHVQCSGSSAPSTLKMNLSRVALISALTIFLVFSANVLVNYRIWGYYEFSASDRFAGILLLVLLTIPLVVKAIQRRAWNGR
jgi:hypothetical protein